MHLELRHLRLIVGIADAGGVTRAGKRLNLTQSALSHQLRDIESRLKLPLFLRVNKRMVITQAGERLLVSARRVLAEVDGVERELMLGEFAGGAGLLRIATECYTCYHWLPAVMKEFRAAWPRVELRIVPEVTSRPMAALAEGALDVAIVAGTEAHARARYTPLFDADLVVVTHPEHRFAHRPCVEPEDFADEHLILYSTPDSESTVIQEILRPARVEPRQLSRIQLTEAILELVKADLGVTVLARWAVAPYLEDRSLSATQLTRAGFHRTWYAATRLESPPLAYLDDFTQLLARNAFPAGLERRAHLSA